MLLNFEKIRERYSLEITGVLQVGGYIGDDVDLYQKMGIPRGIFFEPEPENYKKLKERLLQCKEAYVPLQFALGSRDDVVDMYVAENFRASSSLLKPKTHLDVYKHIEFSKVIKVKMSYLDRLIHHVAGRYNFLNIDVQGYELEVLKGAKKTLNYIDGVMCEVNKDELFENCSRVNEVDDYLEPYGFKRVETGWAYGWGDAYYHKFK